MTLCAMFNLVNSFSFILITLVYFVNGTDKEVTLQGYFSVHDVTIQKNALTNITFITNGTTNHDIRIDFNYTDKSVVKQISSIIVEAGNNTNSSYNLELNPLSIGHTILYANATLENMTDLSKAYMHVSVYHTEILVYISEIVGWVYFAAWSISFYPQTYMNFKRKSVIGLHFDFLSLNIVGFLFYSIFNLGLYCIPSIETQYFARHRYGVNPVQLNDVIFSIHAFFACLIQVVQCMIYDRGEQQVSRTARSILVSIAIASIIFLILSCASVLQWLDFLYCISYIKLFITLIKYIPQVYYNYRRRSTSGWSIGNVLLDFVGGFLSITQMFIIAYNFNDWASIFGDPTKFGLGFFSILFDIVFMLQHYVFFRPRKTPSESLLSAEDGGRDVSESEHNNYGAVTE